MIGISSVNYRQARIEAERQASRPVSTNLCQIKTNNQVEIFLHFFVAVAVASII